MTVVAPSYRREAEAAQSLADLGVELHLPLRPARREIEALRALVAKPTLIPAAARLPWLAWQAEVFWRHLAPQVRELLATRPIHGTVIDNDFAAAWARHLPGSVPAGLVLPNVWWRYLERRAATVDGLRRRALGVESRRYLAHIKRELPRFSWLCAVSETDAAEVSAVARRLQVAVIPNGVDAARLRRVPPSQDADASLLFTGTLSYPPNAEAVGWFVKEVLPRVREQRPDITLTIVGRDPPSRVARLAADPVVRVVGWVDDIAKAYAHATVVVAPLRTGSGTKLKVLEALAAARPLVATSVAAEGIEIEDGEHVLVADDAARFADAVVLLLGDAALRRRIAEAGRQRVGARYDWDALGERLSEELERWLKR